MIRVWKNVRELEELGVGVLNFVFMLFRDVVIDCLYICVICRK